jgi:chemotaxis protein methyltransferase CheR
VAVSDTDFQFVRQLVRDDSALALADGKEYLVESRLASVAEREGFVSVAELVQRVRAGAPGLRRHIVEALATHESLFFRDLHPFEALRQVIIPAALQAGAGRRLTLWSAAAAAGQEAYSLALMMREHFPRAQVTILATDLSREVLDRAESGRFSQLEVNRGLPAALLIKHFVRDGRQWQLHDDVRRMVTFRQLNLAGPLSRIPPMDVVFLRNLLIYFDTQAKEALLNRVSKVLRPDGYLFLGAAETTYGLDNSYERVQVGRSICYRLTAQTRMTSGRDRR